MPSVRPEGAARCARHYLVEMEPHPFELRLHIAQQNQEPDPKGAFKVNELIDGVPVTDQDWLFSPADDTLQDPGVLRRLGEVLAEHPDAQAVCFGILLAPGYGVCLKPGWVLPGWASAGQAFLRRDLVGNRRYDWPRWGGLHDGAFLEALYRQAPDRFVFVDEYRTAFNRLEWK